MGEGGIFEELWQAGLVEYGDLEGISWRWQSIDGAMMKAPLAEEAVGPNSTDRGEMAASVICWWTGVASPGRSSSRVPIGMTSRNWKPYWPQPWSKPQPQMRRSKHLCADAGYTGAPALCVIEQHGYIPHVKGRGQGAAELKHDPSKRAGRWVVEVAHSWFNRFRKLLVRYEKLERSFLVLNHLAIAIIVLRTN